MGLEFRVYNRFKEEKGLSDDQIDLLYERVYFDIEELKRYLSKTKEELLEILDSDFYADNY